MAKYGKIESITEVPFEERENRVLYNAMIKIKDERTGPNEQYNSIGCSIKWK